MEFDVTFLDIGHGDCSVIVFTEPDAASPGKEVRRCIVVDGGDEGSAGVKHLQPDAPSAAWRLADYLKARKIRRIDLLVATHIDSDHIGGLLTFLEEHTAKDDGQGDTYWNDRRVCIGQYWGPMRDTYWGLIDKEQGKDERERYHEMMQLLVKLKVKKKQAAGDQEEIERLEQEITRLRETLDALLEARGTRELVVQSVRQNYDLGELVRPHVEDPSRDILAPDLSPPPQSPFSSVRIDFLWPDLQIPDSMIRASLFRPVNVASALETPSARRRPESLPELLERVLDNQEYLARSEDRKANNRSIVLSVRPSAWSGPGEICPVVLLTGDAESESWGRMVSRYAAEELSAYILKVPHHGSGVNGITPEALQAIQPRFAIISVGQVHALPQADTLNALRQAVEGPLDIFCTERNHNPAKCGPCLDTPPGCVRGKWEDYRGVIFGFDSAKVDFSVVALRFRKKLGDRYNLEFDWVRNHESDPDRTLWCRQEAWEAN